MLRRERLCDDDEEITRGGEERADMEIWWCWLLRAAVPLNVHISLSLSSHTLFVQIIITSCISLSSHCIFSFTTTSLPCPLSLSLSLVCVCLSIYLDGWRARTGMYFCVHTHILCVSTMCSLVWPLLLLPLPTSCARALN